MSYFIQEVKEFYSAKDQRNVLEGDEGPLLFDTSAAAHEHIEKLNQSTYWLAHNQYGVDHRVLDANKPRNRALLEEQS